MCEIISRYGIPLFGIRFLYIVHTLIVPGSRSKSKIKKIYILISERKYKLKTKLYNCTYICIVYLLYLMDLLEIMRLTIIII